MALYQVKSNFDVCYYMYYGYDWVENMTVSLVEKGRSFSVVTYGETERRGALDAVFVSCNFESATEASGHVRSIP